MDQVGDITRAIRRLEEDLRVLKEARAVLLRVKQESAPLDISREVFGAPAASDAIERQREHEALGKVILQVLSDKKPRSLADFHEEIGRVRPGTNYKHLAGWLARASRNGRLKKVGWGVYQAP